MRTLCALFIVATASTLLADTMPAIAADLPDNSLPTAAYAPRARVYRFVPGCRLGVERWFDGYGWHIRHIQICN